MAHFASAVKQLVHSYAQGEISAEELLDEVLMLEEAYFSLYGEEFKTMLKLALVQQGRLSPRERVEARQAFYEAFFDRAAGIGHYAP